MTTTNWDRKKKDCTTWKSGQHLTIVNTGHYYPSLFKFINDFCFCFTINFSKVTPILILSYFETDVSSSRIAGFSFPLVLLSQFIYFSNSITSPLIFILWYHDVISGLVWCIALPSTKTVYGLLEPSSKLTLCALRANQQFIVSFH